ncbi:MAG TPA: hypothetical protein VJB05_01465 [archaeon]|nr:hypothetical protein [archaeon]
MKTSTKVILGAFAAAAAVAATRKAIEAYNGTSFDGMTAYDNWSPVPEVVARELRASRTNTEYHRDPKVVRTRLMYPV